MLRPKALNLQTGQKMAGACPDCGYMEDIKHHTIPNNEQLSLSAYKNDALSYLTSYSLFSDGKTFNHRFDNYITNSMAQKRVLTRCEGLANEIIGGNTEHILLMGITGVGKTHLAVGMMYYIFEQTGYKRQVFTVNHGIKSKQMVNWKILFIDWRELVENKKRSISDSQLAKQVNKTMDELKRADIVILDDFGSERSTDYSLDLADTFWRNRENKTVITTTNFTGDDLYKRYGPRTISRMKHHGTKSGVAFGGIDDQRN
ncbi:ATP-binding protein [Lactiplantibacillus daowaiensis]|uniref:ATP-binding protein n=1 Tax=Lactiplantibacillus daowaiensis TaxID=2559918 RepID=A0ABW1RX46_9LACO|nr:ATP-binding protein [Lactiplantibacillus daowaiensis]